ncbi:MAG: phosphatase PAP2 family protein [Chitinispirillales bacterium]|jgi:undecaprenyl-diphosphatase|nr:phosphatase PAP2 family protein [Chitinispirillales bacterium]
MLEFLHDLDVTLFLLFNAQLTHPLLDSVIPRITHFSFWVVPGLLAAVLFIFREKKKALVALLLVALAAGLSDLISSHIIKQIFARPRPCHPDMFIEGGRFLIGMYRSYSFPSSHSMSMFTIAAVLGGFYPKRRIYFFAFASMIAYSRVYCGVHFPSDIFCGAVWGILLGWGIFKIKVEILKLKK